MCNYACPWKLLKQNTGYVQESASGLTHVANPANPSTFARQAANGSYYIEFSVPANSLRKSSTGVMSIPGPNSVHSRARVKAGGAPIKMPAFENLEVVKSVSP